MSKAFYFTYNGQERMITENGKYGYRVSDDAHRPGTRLFVEDTAATFRAFRKYQDEVFAQINAGIDSIEEAAAKAAAWNEEMEWDAFTAQDDEHLEWLAELAAQDDERQGLQWGE